jgi:hypothetical protein
LPYTASTFKRTNILEYSSISWGRVTSILAVGVSRATNRSSKIQKPADGTAARSVMSGIMPIDTFGR